MDCFYAAIEVRDRPALRGKPIGVGGARNRRGVLTTCNYEARQFGVRSAMPTFMALQRCPSLIVLPTRFDVYRREAAVIRAILHRFTPLVEPLSLDEAYLDVTEHPGAPAALAQVMREMIFHKTKLTSSAGIGPNKLIAKIASEINKPDGQLEVTPEQVPVFQELRAPATILARGVAGTIRKIRDRIVRSLPRDRSSSDRTGPGAQVAQYGGNVCDQSRHTRAMRRATGGIIRRNDGGPGAKRGDANGDENLREIEIRGFYADDGGAGGIGANVGRLSHTPGGSFCPHKRTGPTPGSGRSFRRDKAGRGAIKFVVSAINYRRT